MKWNDSKEEEDRIQLEDALVLLTERAVISRGLRYRAMGWMYCHNDHVSMLKRVLIGKAAEHYYCIQSNIQNNDSWKTNNFIFIYTEMTDQESDMLLASLLSTVIINILNAPKRLDAKVYSLLFLGLLKETK